MNSNDTIDVMILHRVPQEHQAYISNTVLQDYPQIQVHYIDEREEQLGHASQMDVLVGRRVELEILEAADKLKLFVFPGTGVDGLLKTYQNYSRRSEVILCNTHRSSYNCAQHAVAMLLTLLNQVIIHDGRMRNQEPMRRDPETILLKNTKVGLLGYGPINQYVHQFIRGFKPEILVLRRECDSSLPDGILCFTPASLDAFLEQVDVLIIALPLTEETKGMIGEKELKSLGEQSILINVARGGIVDQDALFLALQSKIIAAAGLDVWYHLEDENKYGYRSDLPFHDLENVILSPHRANSGGDITRWDPVFTNIKKLARGEADYEYMIDINRGY